MADYRSKVYDNYESKFNRVIGNVTEKDLKSQSDHYKVKLLPFIAKFSLKMSAFLVFDFDNVSMSVYFKPFAVWWFLQELVHV